MGDKLAIDPRQHVNPGDPIRLAASQINGLNQLLSPAAGYSGGGMREQDVPYTWVMCRASVTVPRWGVLAITGIANTPAATGTAADQFQQLPVVTGETPTTTTTSWGVAVEPIASGSIGRLAVGGVVQIKAANLGKASGAHVLWKDSTWALIRLQAGLIRGTFSGTWAKGSTTTVTDAVVSGATYTAKNYFASLTGGGTKACAIAQAGGEWILVAAEC